jgi:phosphoribosylformylglycinamidine synthase
MLLLKGKPSFPAFRRARLTRRISDRERRRIEFEAHDLFLIDGPASKRPPERLGALLDAAVWRQPAGDCRQRLVLPRVGTRTPWASKASDILTRCGLARFSGIEHGILLTFEESLQPDLSALTWELLHDRMTQVVVPVETDLLPWLEQRQPEPLVTIELGDDPAGRLAAVNQRMGLALSPGEIDYLVEAYSRLERDPTDAELMMFAQANSEHCRHKIFNARWTVDGIDRDASLFDLIRRTHAITPTGTLAAYDDNAAVIEGFPGRLQLTTADDPVYRQLDRDLHFQIKVETHNHPTAISPDPGAATGAGGEIRDESATGRGGRPAAALTGFSVSDLRIPDALQPWEQAPAAPARLASACQIMLEGPIGAARFNNEFGRPALLGYFRSFSAEIEGRLWGYHKPIMIAGGSGTLIGGQVDKHALEPGDRIIVLGGPAMLIGLGGGAASSMSSGQSDAELDFASVQRGNPEMQRRCQEVIDRCWSQGESNPIKSIHDVGAGGLSNALPELLHDGGVGGSLDLRAIPSADAGLSPMAIWCNEAQERYVLAVAAGDVERFGRLCARERCPWAEIGPATGDGRLVVEDTLTGRTVVDLDLDLLLGRPPSMHRDARRAPIASGDQGLAGIELDEAIERVLNLPAVGSKQFLITIGDRTIGGLTARDPMVGPYQVPVADFALTLSDYAHDTGCAMAMGERTPLAVDDAPASARMSVGEVLTNLVGVGGLARDRIKLSANWMAAAGAGGQDAALRAAVEAASEFCRALELAIPVGKDSLSMQTVWEADGEEQRMIAPVSLIVSGFAPVADVSRHRTPMLQSGKESTVLLLVELGGRRLGCSALAQVFGRDLGAVADVDDPSALRALFDGLQELVGRGLVLACHDRSDGGLLTTVLEMALAGHCGVELDTDALGGDRLAALFNEELGVVLQVREHDQETVVEVLSAGHDSLRVRPVGRPRDDAQFVLGGTDRRQWPMVELADHWSRTSYRMQRLRDHPDCADEERSAFLDWSRPGLEPRLSFDPSQRPRRPGDRRPRVAILREQGVNGQREMAAAFTAAGFEAVDVHMSDLEAGRARLDAFHGLVACGGFSFGDVLGAGQGWARSILFNEAMGEQFERFFHDPARFALGVCNGCQMLASLKSIIPGASAWPAFGPNRSAQFEARLSLVEVTDSPSLFFAGMAGSRVPVATAHGEGRALFDGADVDRALIALRYVDGHGRPTERYPDNPNGSPQGITGLCNDDGRVTILMPHPERLLRTVNFSWAPPDWTGSSPWMRPFFNARAWLD